MPDKEKTVLKDRFVISEDHRVWDKVAKRKLPHLLTSRDKCKKKDKKNNTETLIHEDKQSEATSQIPR